MRTAPDRKPDSWPAAATWWLAALLALGGAGGAMAQNEEDSPAGPEPARHPVEGVWRWSFPMPDGSTARPKLVLSVKDGMLQGSSSVGPGTEAPITNAVLGAGALRFQVVRRRADRPIVTTYTGQWKTNEIRGSIESDWAGEIQTFEWLAQRAHAGLEGTWQWTNSFARPGAEGGGPRGRGGPGLVIRAEFEQNGEHLTGQSWFRRAGRRTEIKNGSVKKGRIHFEVERQVGDDKLVTRYEGEQSGDVIRGTAELIVPDAEPRKMDWRARRVD